MEIVLDSDDNGDKIILTTIEGLWNGLRGLLVFLVMDKG